jgi:hypothetical protein
MSGNPFPGEFSVLSVTRGRHHRGLPVLNCLGCIVALISKPSRIFTEVQTHIDKHGRWGEMRTLRKVDGT